MRVSHPGDVGDGGVLSMYDDLIWNHHRDDDRANTYFNQAVQSSPSDWHFMRLDINKDLLTAMAERWCPEVHTFHFPEGEMTITLRDVAILTGLPVTGEAIIGNSSKPEGDWGPLILERLGLNMPTTTPVQGVGHQSRGLLNTSNRRLI
ncbi:unnamed protein product [Linum tenue]|uniref:Aminotransferase-like plant mobile domain-containing protein n=1 Tax=Linum tenue TaxID=586396 RepID=A0AAV0MDK5_9ROSI|nr:unnamed protein product [Linum tenue]